MGVGEIIFANDLQNIREGCWVKNRNKKLYAIEKLYA